MRNEYIRCFYSMKYFYKYNIICIPWPPGSINSLCLHKYETKLVENLLYCGNEYIRYSYSVRYLQIYILYLFCPVQFCIFLYCGAWSHGPIWCHMVCNGNTKVWYGPERSHVLQYRSLLSRMALYGPICSNAGLRILKLWKMKVVTHSFKVLYIGLPLFNSRNF